MKNSLHATTLHKFKYVGRFNLIDSHKFYYKFEQFISIYNLKIKFMKSNNIYNINKTNNQFSKLLNDDNRYLIDVIKLSKLIYNNLTLINKIAINNNLLYNEINHKILKSDNKLLFNGINNTILKNQCKYVYCIDYIKYITKIKNFKYLFDIDSIYKYIYIQRVYYQNFIHFDRDVIFIDKNNINLKSNYNFDRDVIFINKNNLIFKQMVNATLFDILKFINYKILTKNYNLYKMNKYICNKFKSTAIFYKYMNYNVKALGIQNLNYKQISKTIILYKYLNENFRLISIYKSKIYWMHKLNCNINKTNFKFYDIASMNFRRIYILKSKVLYLENIINKNIINFKSNYKNLYKMNSNLYKIKSKYKFMTNIFEYINSLDFNKMCMNSYKNFNKCYYNLKFILELYKEFQLFNNNIIWLSKTYKNIDVLNCIILLKKTYKDININNFMKLLKLKVKSKIIKINYIKLAEAKVKTKILKKQCNFSTKIFESILKNNYTKQMNNYNYGNISKMNIIYNLSKSYRFILKNNIKLLNKNYYNINLSNLRMLQKLNYNININDLSKRVVRNDIQNINLFNLTKFLGYFHIYLINIIKDITKWVEVKRTWWIIEHDNLTDKLIIPNIDYPYESEPFENIKKHPISSTVGIEYQDKEYGNKEIEVSIKIMQQMLNIIFILWHTTKENYKTLSTTEAIEKTMYAFYYWLNIDKVKQNMIKKKSREDYLRIYRWFRWEAESVWIKEKDDIDNTGIKSIGILIANIIKYMKDHHYNIVPLTNKNNLFVLDNMLEAFKIEVPDYYRKSLDKNKGKRKYHLSVYNNWKNKKLLIK